MKILFLGGDKRQLEVINNLIRKQHEIDVVGYDKVNLPKAIMKQKINKVKISDYQVIFFPVSGVKKNFEIKTDFSSKRLIVPSNLLEKVREDVLIFTGIKTPELNNMLKIANKKVIVLMEDDEVKKENSIPTVEGIIGDLIYNTDYTINQAKILVFGYGNVGKLLVDKLKHLGAELIVGVIKEKDYQDLKQQQINVIYTNQIKAMQEVIMNNNIDIIVNTVPELILNKEYLKILNKKVYILDISSHPHGIDFKAAKELNLRTHLWMGVPSVVAPKTAGKILVKKINLIIGGDK